MSARKTRPLEWFEATIRLESGVLVYRDYLAPNGRKAGERAEATGCTVVCVHKANKPKLFGNIANIELPPMKLPMTAIALDEVAFRHARRIENRVRDKPVY